MADSGTSHIPVAIVRERFGKLRAQIIDDALERNGVSFDDFARFVSQHFSVELNSSVFRINDRRISTLGSRLRKLGYNPFYYIVFLEEIVKRYANECQQALEDYKSKYLKRFLLQSMHKVSDCGDWRLCLMVDRDWDEMCKFNKKEVAKKLASIIDIPKEHLRVDCVRVLDNSEPSTVYRDKLDEEDSGDSGDRGSSQSVSIESAESFVTSTHVSHF